MKKIIIFKILIILLLHKVVLLSQNVLTLETAISTALKNNKSIKDEQLKAAYQQQLIATSKAIAPTNINTEFGQINSAFFDTKLGVSQTILLPKVYQSQKAVYQKEWEAAVLGIAIQERMLKKAVRYSYMKQQYLRTKQRFLLQTDSILQGFIQKSNLRFEKGESNILEKTSANAQHQQLNIQLQMLDNELKLSQLELVLLMNVKLEEMPKILDENLGIEDKTLLLNVKHPNLSYWQQQQQLADALVTAEKSKLLPEFNVGLSSVSIRGIGADNVDYSWKTRFQSAQVGVSLPLFKKSQLAKIEATKINKLIATNALEKEQWKLQNDLEQAVATYQKSKSALDYYQANILKNATLIHNTATQQFNNGEINYLEWSMLINQAHSLKLEYIELLNQHQQSIIEILYLIEEK